MITNQIKQEIEKEAEIHFPRKHDGHAGTLRSIYVAAATTALSKPEWMWPMVEKFMEWFESLDTGFLYDEGEFKKVQYDELLPASEEVKAAFIEHLKNKENA